MTIEKYRCKRCGHIFEYDDEENMLGGVGGMTSFDEGRPCPECEYLSVRVEKRVTKKMRLLLDMESDIVDSYIGDENEDRYLVRILIRLLDPETKEEIHDDRNWLMFLKLMPNAEITSSTGCEGTKFGRAEILFSIDKRAYKYHNSQSFADFLPKQKRGEHD